MEDWLVSLKYILVHIVPCRKKILIILEQRPMLTGSNHFRVFIIFSIMHLWKCFELQEINDGKTYFFHIIYYVLTIFVDIKVVDIFLNSFYYVPITLYIVLKKNRNITQIYDYFNGTPYLIKYLKSTNMSYIYLQFLRNKFEM